MITKVIFSPRFAAVLAAIVAPLYVFADPVSEAEARQKAQFFLQQRNVRSSLVPIAMHTRRAATVSAGSSYYLYNVGSNEGFVIVSGDDRTPAILGYADNGTLSEDNLPDGLRYLLDGYEEQMEWLDSHEDAAATRTNRASAARTAISPLVQTQWNQGAPYNNNCPVISDEKTVTGCVATSMAQLMYYHQCPTDEVPTIPSYTKTTKDKDMNTYSLTVDALPAATFDWSDMTTTYTTSTTGTSADAVAELMQYCGVSLQMKYGLNANGGSSAYNASIPEALKVYFGYDGTTTYVQRHHYTYTEWVDMIYAELANSRPVILGGQATGGGHSFVCDGYDTDDYFHINWGWGGSSDGYYRLSLLNPLEQGIGGSSTLDGFSYTQDAVIGIKPYSDTSTALSLALEKMQFDSAGSVNTVEVTRDAAENAFTISSLYFVVCNYTFTQTAFDYKVVLTDGTTTYDLAGAENQSINFNTNSNNTLTDASTPKGLTDGTYYIKVLSRVNGTTDWQECYDGEKQQITAVVNGNTMTLTAPVVCGTSSVPSSVVFTVSGTPTVGYEQTVIASVTGGNVDYYGDLVLRVKTDENKAVMGKTVEIPAGKTVDVTFSYIPSTAGDNVLTLYAKNISEVVSGSKTIYVVASDATSDLNLTCTYTLDNLDSQGHLYGNGMRATVTISNASTEQKYVGQLNCSARQWTRTSETTDNGNGTSTTTTTWSWQSLGVTQYALEVDKSGSTVVNIAADDLPAEGYYSFRLSYRRVKSDAKVDDLVQIGYDETAKHGTLQISDGYSLTDANGNTTIYAPSTSIDAGSAAFVDLSSLSLDGVTVTASSNPNCVYLLAADATVPSGLSGKNVVKGTTAETFALTDGYDFYTPIDFTATAATYTRTFDLAAAGTSGWSTLLLPFAATTVTVNNTTTNTNREATWFTSDSDTNGSFWLCEFSADAEGSVTFDYAQQLKANTPYIIAVPGDTWGEDWKMTGYPVTFTASDAAITATAMGAVSGNTYKFCGNTVGTALSDCYVLNTKGSKFVKNSTTTAPAFRGWFAPFSITSLSMPALSISSPDFTGIFTIGIDAIGSKAQGWYSLDGRRLGNQPTKKGLYIHNGKKIAVK